MYEADDTEEEKTDDGLEKILNSEDTIHMMYNPPPDCFLTTLPRGGKALHGSILIDKVGRV